MKYKKRFLANILNIVSPANYKKYFFIGILCFIIYLIHFIFCLNHRHMQNIKTFLLLILFTFIISAQNINFKHLTIQDGLSQSTVNCIFQDSKGFMWFGTQDGLNKYDGYKFTIYRPQSDNEFSIKGTDILSINEDTLNHPGSLWIGTHGGGLNRFDLITEKFTSFNRKTGLSHDRIDNIFFDNEGTIWLATAGSGLNKIKFDLSGNPQVKIFESAERDTSTLSNNYVCYIKSDPVRPEKFLWIGTYKGLNRLEKSTGKITWFYNHLNDHFDQSNKIRCIQRIKIQNTDYLLLGTSGGLFLFDLSQSIFSRLNIDVEVKDDVFAILNPYQNEYWIASYNGLYKIKYAENNQWRQVQHFLHNTSNQSSLSNNHIISLLMDNSGVLWIGTHGNGLSLYDKKASKFICYNNKPGSIILLRDNNIKSIHEDLNEDAVWIGSHNSGLLKYNYQTKQSESYSTSNSLLYNRIQTIAQEPIGILWLGGFIGGLQKFNTKNMDCRQFLHNPFDSASISNNNVNSTLIDNRNRLWVGTYGGGINLFNKSEESFIRFKHNPSDSLSISSDMTRSIYQDSDGAIWIGSEGGLSLVIENNNKVNFKNIKFGNGLSDIHIFSICEVKSGKSKTLWIGTEGDGVIAYTPSNGRTKHFTTADGLPNNVIYSIQQDLNGDLWIGSNFGLSKLNMEDTTFINFTEEDGLQSNEFNFGASCRRRNGELLFGGIGGINAFFPEDIYQNNFKPPIVLSDFRIFNEPVHINGSVLDKSLNYTNTIELPFSKNFFSFEFSALHYYKTEKNEYAYSLRGFEDKWNYVKANRRYVTYTNLDPGEYVFQVKATNNDGIWNPKEKNINIIIHPPFWQQWWFQLTVIFIVAGILFLLYRYRIKRLLEIERLRVRIASDLHDDIGSALTRISVHSEIIQNSDDKKIVRTSSGKIGTMSREIITTMSDIVWSIDARNDLMKNLIDRMKDFSTSLLVEKDIQLKFKYKGLDINKKLPIHIRQNLFLIFKEAINNIFKHSNATNSIVDINNSSKKFQMIIKDDGIGFNTENIPKGNGLKNMRMRAKRIGAEISLNSNNGVELILNMKNF
jgi:ligand-binding sensor domain-containing protein/two-component sensor histidine kinase